jgi:hypothetical protein
VCKVRNLIETKPLVLWTDGIGVSSNSGAVIGDFPIDGSVPSGFPMLSQSLTRYSVPLPLATKI